MKGGELQWQTALRWKRVIHSFARHVVWNLKSQRLAAAVLEGKAAALSLFSAVEKTWPRSKWWQVGGAGVPLVLLTPFCSGQRIREMRMDRNKIKSAVSTRRKTDSAKWREATFKPLTYAQIRIRQLCDAFHDGQITKEEFKRELPTILSARDREKRDVM
jgi:hypothetical protein